MTKSENSELSVKKREEGFPCTVILRAEGNTRRKAGMRVLWRDAAGREWKVSGNIMEKLKERK
ncbi:MAG: hypothetical protein LUH20_05335 [Lachnospiraceae bacterium]|nr:hypothetical protein [Lachnospiraceae bacterium]